MRLPRLIIPTLVCAALLAGYGLRTLFTQPTTNRVFADGTGAKAIFVIDGVRCKGTAMFLSSLYEEQPGVLSIETFATERMAVFRYDPLRITPERIQIIMETPVPFEDGTSRQVFKCQSIRQ